MTTHLHTMPDYYCVSVFNSAYIPYCINNDERGINRAARKIGVKIKRQIGWLVLPVDCYV
jgi:hypothetical protein